jgi:predicted protein tyrosine phosphatase
MSRNRLSNVANRFQGQAKRVLCVCSGGLLRSPTAAVVLSREPWNYNTRAAGSDQEFALIAVDEVLLTWADEIVCMEPKHTAEIKTLLNKFALDAKPIITLCIPDVFARMEPVLQEMIAEAYKRERDSLSKDET